MRFLPQIHQLTAHCKDAPCFLVLEDIAMLILRAARRISANSLCSRHGLCVANSVRGVKTTAKSDAGDKHLEVPPSDPKYGGDADVYLIPGLKKRPPGPKTPEEFADPNQKNWVSYGFDYVDQKEDKILMHVVGFTGVTLLTVLASWILLNYPDHSGTDWAQREAFLELHRREKLGLPLVDRNYVDPATVVLPTEEQLRDFEVYI